MRLDFYFDYSSPFGYLASTQIERIAAAHRASLVWKPILLGGLFRAIGTPMVPLDAMPDAKRRYYLADMQRWAAHWGLPLRFPSTFPLRTVDALRLTMLAPAAARPALVHAIMRAAWVEDRDPADPAVLRLCAAEAGIDPALVGGVGAPHIKDELRAATDEAVQRGVPGVPTFFVDDLLFWGQDRLMLVEKALDGWRPLRG